MEYVRFTVPIPPRALSPNSRSHWGTRRRAAEMYAESVWLDGRIAMTDCYAYENGRGYQHVAVSDFPWPKAHVRLTWRSQRLPDQDNALATLKCLVDCLTTKGRRPLGIVVDDNPESLTVEINTEQVKTAKEAGILVEVTRA